MIGSLSFPGETLKNIGIVAMVVLAVVLVEKMIRSISRRKALPVPARNETPEKGK